MKPDPRLARYPIGHLVWSRRVCDLGELGCGAWHRCHDSNGERISNEDIQTELEHRYTRERAEFWMHEVNKVQKVHTRLLMKWLRESVLYRGWYAPTEEYALTSDDIKAILATRPHAPSRREGKKIRQEAARKARRGKRG